jgi:23S rRNA (cytidine1920-2'-O)/16S rRNA (cytidine1409-2'-O)-methyltransferase
MPDLGVADLSFISLTKVLPALWALLQPPHEVILLVKPQFEVGRDRLGKNGVVRNPRDRAEAIATVWQAAEAIGWHYGGLVRSPITGPAGNVEFLLWLRAEEIAGRSAPTLVEFLAVVQTADD